MRKTFLRRLTKALPERQNQLIQIFAGRALYMEGCKRVLACDEDNICLEGDYFVSVRGQGLRLRQLGTDAVCAQGSIQEIRFDRIVKP